MRWKKKEEKIPEIEPPCPACVEARAAAGNVDALCAYHMERRERHTYHYRREIPFRQHDSNVIPTGVDMSRR